MMGLRFLTSLGYSPCVIFVFRHFAVPAFSYCVFNALAFYNLRLVTPPTYRLLINLKVLFSGLMLQTLIKTKLTKRQWGGLCLLVVACGVEQWDSFDLNTGQDTQATTPHHRCIQKTKQNNMSADADISLFIFFLSSLFFLLLFFRRFDRHLLHLFPGLLFLFRRCIFPIIIADSTCEYRGGVPAE